MIVAPARSNPALSVGVACQASCQAMQWAYTSACFQLATIHGEVGKLLGVVLTVSPLLAGCCVGLTGKAR